MFVSQRSFKQKNEAVFAVKPKNVKLKKISPGKYTIAQSREFCCVFFIKKNTYK